MHVNSLSALDPFYTNATGDAGLRGETCYSEYAFRITMELYCEGFCEACMHFESY